MIPTEVITCLIPTIQAGSDRRSASTERHASNLQPTAKVGRYHIIRLIGKGGMGVVYEAEDELLGRRVALKFLPTALAQRPHSLDRLLGEAKAAASLNHPHIVAVYDVEQKEDLFFIVMELLNPRSLGAYISEEGPLHWSEATRILLDCCSALHAAHAAGLVHRDIKPDNILCAPSGSTKLADFGLARDLRELQKAFLDAPTISGTPVYMSPEQCNNEQLDGRTDIYSLGTTYYTLLTGKPPRTACGKLAGVLRQKRAPFPDPRELVPDIPENCVRVLMRATANDPRRRFQSAREMLAELESALVGVAQPPFRFLVPFIPSLQPVQLRINALRTTRRRSGIHGGGTVGVGPGIRLLQIAGKLSARGLYLPILAGLALILTGVMALDTVRGMRKSKALSEVINKQAKPPIKVGIMYSVGASDAVGTCPVVDATLLAIDELNDRGGILGRRIEVIARGSSGLQGFAQAAERLIQQDQVVTLFGAWNSIGYNSIRPVVEKYNHLLVFPGPYEGLEDSPNILYSGSVATQLATQALRYAVERVGYRRFFLIGPKTVSSLLTLDALVDEIKARDGSVVGRRAQPLDAASFTAVAKEIAAARPHLIISTLSNEASIAFHRSLEAAGLSAERTPTLLLAADDSILAQPDDINLAGDYLSGSYFQSLATPENLSFVQRFKRRYGPHRTITDATEAAYVGVYLWAEAVSRSGTDKPQLFRSALKRQSFLAPSGPVHVEPDNNHTCRTFHIAKVITGNSLEILKDSVQWLQPGTASLHAYAPSMASLVQPRLVHFTQGLIGPITKQDPPDVRLNGTD